MTELQLLVIALTMGITSALKKGLAGVPVLRDLPIPVYVILIAFGLMTGLVLLGMVEADSDLTLKTVYSAAAASGARDWWQNRMVTPHHRDMRK